MSTGLPDLATADLLSSVALMAVLPGGAALAATADAASRLLAVSTMRFRTATRQHISQVVDDEITLDTAGSTVLLLPELPVTAVTAITLDGTVLTGPFEFSRAGMLNRTSWASIGSPVTDPDLWPTTFAGPGWKPRFPDGYGRVQVTYTHGWEVIPADIQHAVVEDAIALANTQNVYTALTLGRGAVFTYRPGGTTAAWDMTVEKYRVRR